MGWVGIRILFDFVYVHIREFVSFPPRIRSLVLRDTLKALVIVEQTGSSIGGRM